MRTPIQTGRVRVNGIVDAGECTGGESAPETALGRVRDRRGWRAALALLLLWVLAALPAQANISPPGCRGSGLGISLFTSIPDVHIGDRIFYSVLVFNTPFPACDASEIQASVVTPDGVTNPLTLRRTTLAPGESDFYTNIVSYVVRAEDIQPDGTVRATASDEGAIHQNDTNSKGGGFQGVNTEVNMPGIALTVDCTGSVGQNGAILLSGTVSNTGNNTLVGVRVTNVVNGASFHVAFLTNLARGQSAPFTGSWVPANPCEPSTAVLTAYGTDEFTATPRTVTSTVSTTCANVLTPGVELTLECPPAPVAAGQMVVLKGQIKNTGDVALKDLVVLGNQPAPNTQVFTLALLAPGATANFSGSFAAPADACTVTTTASLQGATICGTAVSDSATVTCNLVTAPQINVTVVCPENPVGPGATLTYSGTVKNTGNVTLNEVTVVSDRPAQGTVIFNGGTMAPGATANFSGSYTVPADGCSVSVTVGASGKDNCTAVAVNHTATATCLSTTAPGLAVTLACPPTTVTAGQPITYSGTVRNTGNIALNNVVVLNGQPEATRTVFGPVRLAVGAASDFSFTLTAPADACSVTTSVTARGDDACKATAITSVPAETTCPLTSAPAIDLTLACPTAPVGQGGTLTFSGTIKNTGNMTLTNVVVRNDRVGATPVFSAPTLAPAAVVNFTGSYQVGADVCSVTSTATVEAMSVCGTLVQKSVSSTCTLQTQPQINVTVACPEARVAPGSTLTYGGTVRNTGNVTLNDVVVVSDRPGQGTVIFNGGTMAPGATANFTGSYTVPVDGCSVSVTVAASGKDNCTAVAVNHSATATCLSTTTPGLAVTIDCPPNTVAAGQPITYSGTVRNTGNIALNNVVVQSAGSEATKTLFGPVSLAVGAFTNYTATFATSSDNCSVTHTVTAQGQDACSAAPVAAVPQAATCNLTSVPAIDLTLACPAVSATPGSTLTFSGTVKNTGNMTLTNVVVRNDRVGSTPVFSALTLAPAAVVSFTGSYAVEADVCSVTSTATVEAMSVCGVVVQKSVTSTCTIQTQPQIQVTVACPEAKVAPGSTLTYSGTVKNTGNVTLKDVTVVSDRPTQGTVVFNPGTLAPGAAANFTGSYTVPADGCSVSVTVAASGKDNCSSVAVNHSATAVCQSTTTPSLAVTIDCPPNTVAAGKQITYSGTVRNTGNIALNNVVVLSAGSEAARTLFGPVSLAVGASTPYTATFATSLDTCSTTHTVMAQAQDACSSAVVKSDPQAATCTLLTAPAIQVSHECPVTPLVPGGEVVYQGSVRNSGDVTLANVVVTGNLGTAASTVTTLYGDDAMPAGSSEFLWGGDTWNWVTNNPTPVSGSRAHQSVVAAGVHQHVFENASETLSVGAGDVLFTHVYLDPENLPTQVMVEWQVGTGSFAHRAYWGANQINLGQDGTDSRRYIGPLPAAGQWVRLEVPASRVGLEGLAVNGMAFTLYGGRATWDASGKVSSTDPGNGEISTVFTVASLAPGETRVFTATNTVPSGGACAFTSTLTAVGGDKCTGTQVTATSTKTCPIVTAPAIAVTHECPATLVSAGGMLTYRGVVRNTGNIALNNVTVKANRPADDTVVFTVATLAPGASAEFTGTYQVPINCCVVWSTLTATGDDACNENSAIATDTTACTVLTTPKLVVTKVCPAEPLEPGALLEYSGTVSNAGDIALINVVVQNDQSGNLRVLGPITLAPGESVEYQAAYTVPIGFCGTDKVSASGLDVCSLETVSDSVTTTCPIVTKPRIAVVQHRPASPTPKGGIYTFSGTVSNPGNVTLKDVYVVNNYQPDCYTRTNSPVLGPIELKPGQSRDFSGTYNAPWSCCEILDTVSVHGADACTGTVVKASASQVAPLLSTPAIHVTRSCPGGAVPVGSTYNFSGLVRNSGDVALTNVFVYLARGAAADRTSSLGTPLIGPLELAPGESKAFTGAYPVVADSDPAADNVTARGTDICEGITVSAYANCFENSEPTGLVVGITMTEGGATLTWNATAGVHYRVQSATGLQNPVWTDLPGDVTATGPTASKTHAVGSSTYKLYRIKVVQ